MKCCVVGIWLWCLRHHKSFLFITVPSVLWKNYWIERYAVHATLCVAMDIYRIMKRMLSSPSNGVKVSRTINQNPMAQFSSNTWGSITKSGVGHKAYLWRLYDTTWYENLPKQLIQSHGDSPWMYSMLDQPMTMKDAYECSIVSVNVGNLVLIYKRRAW